MTHRRFHRLPSALRTPVAPAVGRRKASLADRFTRRLLLPLIIAALTACSSTDRLRDTQVRPTDRPECNVGTMRRDLDTGLPTLIGGTGCRADPSNPRPLNKRTE
jgi:hypothetical protein